MNSQENKSPLHSLVFIKSCSVPLKHHAALLFRNQNTIPYLKSNFNCLSPNLRDQISGLSFYCQPQKWGTTREIKLQEANSGKYGDKGRRVTLPLEKIDSFNGGQKCLVGLPSKNTKALIKFTYQDSLSSLKPSHLNFNCGNSQNIVLINKAQSTLTNKAIKQHKIIKNRLCSTVLSYSHQPLSTIWKKSQQLQKLLSQLRRQTDQLSQKVASSCDFSKQCKTSAAQTSTSAMAGIKDSEMSFGIPRLNYSQSNSKYIFQGGINQSRPSLTDKIPTSKQLGQTVILNSHYYDFGGLIILGRQSQQEKVQIRSGKMGGLPRKWSQLKGLMSENVEFNLKESIHCGPDVRSNIFNCEALQSFGRTIKQSSVQFHE